MQVGMGGLVFFPAQVGYLPLEHHNGCPLANRIYFPLRYETNCYQARDLLQKFYAKT